MTSLLSPIHHRSITRMAVCEKPGPKISSKRNITGTSPILPLWDVTSRYKDRDGGGLRVSGWGQAKGRDGHVVFNTILGEEFLFRGVLLPRMEGVFVRASWVANGVLFGFYHVHQPWGIPNSVLTGLLYTYPAYRYKSTWMSVIIHSAQSVYIGFLVLGVVLGLA